MASTKLVMQALLASGLGLQLVSAMCSHDVAEKGLEMHNRLMAQREARGMHSKRQRVDSLSQEEGLTDKDAECTAYEYHPLDGKFGEYPPIWQIASIVDGDTEAMAAYNAIVNATDFPNYPPKGTPAGDFSGVQYNASDPDCWWSWSHCDTPKVAGLPVDITVCEEPQTWGLTFDDGPNCSQNALFSYLREQSYTADLYFIGSNVMDWPYQAQEGLADGHAIGVHTWSHRYATALTNEQFFAELWYTRKAIQAVVGVTPVTWRPPYGDVDDRIRFIANSLNLTTVMWEHDTFDWKIQNSGNPNGLPTASVEANYNAVFQDAQQGQFATQGTIVLTHELNNATMSLAIQELPSIASNFKHVVPVAVCRNISHPYVEQSYTYPTFDQYLSTNSTKWTNVTTSSSTSSSPTSTVTGRTSTMTGSSSKGIGAQAAAGQKGAATSLSVGSSSIVVIGMIAAISLL